MSLALGAAAVGGELHVGGESVLDLGGHCDVSGLSGECGEVAMEVCKKYVCQETRCFPKV